MLGPIFIIGQIFGVIAIALGFLSYQMKTAGRILLLQALTGVVFAVHYCMIGAITGMAMNIVCFIRCIVYYFRNKRGSSEKISPIIFTLIMAVIGIITWDAWYSVFVFSGILINTLCMAFANPQKVRASILVTSPLVLIYDAFALSFGGMVYESVAIISAVIGILRNRKRV